VEGVRERKKGKVNKSLYDVLKSTILFGMKKLFSYFLENFPFHFASKQSKIYSVRLVGQHLLASRCSLAVGGLLFGGRMKANEAEKQRREREEKYQFPFLWRRPAISHEYLMLLFEPLSNSEAGQEHY